MQVKRLLVGLGFALLAGLPAAAQEAVVIAAEAGADREPETPEGAAPGEALPLWELGIIGFGLRSPDYPASGRYSNNGLVLPYALYRGDILRVDEEGDARVVPVDTPRFEISLSAGAAFGADSDDNPLREGLPDLDPLGELGLQFVLRGPRFAHGDGSATRLDAAVAVRGVFSVDTSDLGTTYRGMVLEPQLRLRRSGLFGGPLRLRMRLSATFATEELHDYFYEVDPQFARPGRPAFDAEGGYLGSDFGASVTWDATRRVRAFVGGSVSSYAGAANDDSPLFEDELTGALFAGLAYSFSQSRRTVVRGR